MKTLLLALLFSVAAFAQVNFTVTGAIPTAQFTSLEAVRVKTFASVTPTPTLTGAITSAATSLTVSVAQPGWLTGTAAARPATCSQQDPSLFPLNVYFASDTGVISTCVASNTFGAFGAEIVIDNEAMDVTAINASGTATTYTVARGKGQTTAASHSSGAQVNILLYPTAVLWAKQFIRAGLASVLSSDAAVAAQQAVVNSDLATLQSLKNASVQ